MGLRCIFGGCLEDAVDGSNYCEIHAPDNEGFVLKNSSQAEGAPAATLLVEACEPTAEEPGALFESADWDREGQ